MTPRTLIIGLDGATFDLIDPLARAGYLPTLQSLLAESAWGALRCWPAMNSAASWSSIVTGYNAAQHGIFNFGRGWDPQFVGGQTWRPTTGAARKKPAFWRRLSAAGQTVGVINVPLSYPAEPVNGFMLAGMDTPSTSSRGFAHPPDLPAELRRRGMDYIIEAADLGAASQRDSYHLPAEARRVALARQQATLYLMRSRPWDVLMSVIVETDRVQHYFWPRRGAPPDDPSWTPIRELYQQIDGFLAEALACAGDETRLIILSDHGFGPDLPAKRALNALWAHLGLLNYHRGAGGWQGRLLRQLLYQGRRLLPARLQHRLAWLLPSLHLRAVKATRFHRIDWSRTQLSSGAEGESVWVNMRGREPQGIVAPEDGPALCERAREALLRLVDADSGRPLLRQVCRREEIYRGPYLSLAPDLTLEWDFEATGETLCDPAGATPLTIRGAPSASGAWSGVHWPNGIFIARGPGIRPGRLADANILDVTPTLLYLQEQPLPADLDGRVLTELFHAEYLQQHPIRRVEAADTGESTVGELSAEEEQVIAERLRGLGYL